MSDLAEIIANRKVPDGALAIYWLCQAGFAFKTSEGRTVYIDPYFSDCVERVAGFKRMMTCPMMAAEVVADMIICTHEHLDHTDTDALPIIAQNSSAHFVGPVECIKIFRDLGISADRCHLLEEGQTIELFGIAIKGVYADHGELTPDALGIIIDFGGITVYHTGDTAYRPEEFQPAIAMHPDILLPCINGAFGNMNSLEAAQLTQLTIPSVVFPTHFWLFIEQNGDPGRFLQLCAELAPSVRTVITKPGEEYLFQKTL
jgi:L-ascorbate 6-phosphate lactonase